MYGSSSWQHVDMAEAGAADYYVAVHGSWHIKGALNGNAEGEASAAPLVVSLSKGLRRR